MTKTTVLLKVTMHAPLLTALSLASALAASAMAHHSNAMFDFGNPVSLSGSIARVEWTNPHVYVYVDTKDPKGAVTQWTLEMASPPCMEKHGMTRESFVIGAAANVQNLPRLKDPKDGAHGLHVVSLTDGTDVEQIQGAGSLDAKTSVLEVKALFARRKEAVAAFETKALTCSTYR